MKPVFLAALTLSTLITLPGRGHAETIYQYQDDAGTVVFTDQPNEIPEDKLPQTRTRELKTPPRREIQPSQVDSSKANTTVTKTPVKKAALTPLPTVTIYMTSWCGYCKKLKADLSSRGISFVEKDIEKDKAAKEEFVEKFKGGGVPVLLIGEEVMRGYNPERLKTFLSKYQI